MKIVTYRIASLWRQALQHVGIIAVLYALSMPAMAANPTSIDLAKGSCLLATGGDVKAVEAFGIAGAGCEPGTGPIRWLVKNNLNLSMEADKTFVFNVRQTTFSRLTVYLKYSNGEIISLIHDKTNAAAHIEIGGTVHLSVPWRSARLDSVALRAEGLAETRGSFVRPALNLLLHEEAHHDSISFEYGFFAGIIVITLAFNFALMYWLRYDFLFFYCGLTAATGLYGIAVSGLVFRLLPALPMHMASVLAEFSMSIVLWFAVLFTLTLLERGVVPIRLAIVAIVMVTLTVFIGAIGAVTGYHFTALTPYALTAFNVLAGMTLLLAPPTAIIALRRGSKIVYMFALAWTFPIAAGLARVLARLGLIGTTPFIENSHFYAMAFETIISMLGIAYRISRLRNERDSARAREIEFKYLSETDALTGLLNRRAFIEGAILASQGTTAELILLDIDHFKTVNDGFGHDVGDRVLQASAQLLERIAPRAAIVGRLGGEEFAVLVLEPNGSETAHQLLRAFRNTPMPEGIRLTASAGTVIGIVTDELSWRHIYRLADAALYRAKIAGRDRVVVDKTNIYPSTMAAA